MEAAGDEVYLISSFAGLLCIFRARGGWIVVEKYSLFFVKKKSGYFYTLWN